MKGGIVLAGLLLIIVGTRLACNDHKAPQKDPIEVGTATINLSAVANSNQIEVFNEVKQASRLPTFVLDELGGMADPGQPFNATDVVDSRLPMQQLIVAAVSEKHCIVSYWRGGLILRLETTVFEVSDGKVKRKWVSNGGGLDFGDLKNTLESGRILQFHEAQQRPHYGKVE